jgi:hypothetical protein
MTAGIVMTIVVVVMVVTVSRMIMTSLGLTDDEWMVVEFRVQVFFQDQEGAKGESCDERCYRKGGHVKFLHAFGELVNQPSRQ